MQLTLNTGSLGEYVCDVATSASLHVNVSSVLRSHHTCVEAR
jgi:hypothetical protein